MHTIQIKTDSAKSNVIIGDKLANLGKYLPERKVIVVTDANIRKYYGQYLEAYPVIEIGLGEKHKTLDTLNIIFQGLIDHEADRTTFLLGIGGGIVCDIAGFAASIYMRGMPFGFVSTTLLSQVDASVGGKNGVNFEGYKNMVGVFNQPQFVLCDTSMLSTLPKNEFVSGFAEIVKAGAIKSLPLFEYLEANADKALALDQDVLSRLVYESVRIKADVVIADEKEKGERRKLNFGHTFAHSFEKHIGMLHGEAVSIGMSLAAQLSVRLGLLPAADAERIVRLLKLLGLPTEAKLDAGLLFGGMKKDKKREGDFIHMILLNELGNAVVRPVELNELEGLVHDLR